MLSPRFPSMKSPVASKVPSSTRTAHCAPGGSPDSQLPATARCAAWPTCEPGASAGWSKSSSGCRMRDRRPLLWSLSSSGGGHTITLDAILRRFVHHAVGEGDGEAPDLLERTYSMEPRGADVTAYLLALVAAELDSRAERLRRR